MTRAEDGIGLAGHAPDRVPGPRGGDRAPGASPQGNGAAAVPVPDAAHGQRAAAPRAADGVGLPGAAPEAVPLLDTVRNTPALAGRGIALLVGSLFLFTIMDAIGKHLTQSYHPVQVIWARFAGNAVLVLVVLAPRLRSVARTDMPMVHLGRGLTQLGSILAFFFALRHVGLAEATAIMDINPVLITLMAALFLGERIGPHRIAGIVLALVGALIIIRPGAGALHPAAVLPLLGAFIYAFSTILTRIAKDESTATSLLWSTMFCTIASTLAVPFAWGPIAAADLPAFVAIGIVGAVAQALLIRAYSLAEASALAPFGYCGLVFAGFWGWLFWGAVPDAWSLTGAAVIVGAGLYVWARERAG